MVLYDWQKEAVLKIQHKDAVVSAPTGAGKSLVSYIWAGLLDSGVKKQDNIKSRIIFTAPIKALSNERYLDLKNLGFNTGIETGDFKKNTKAEIICCTQEIYTKKYAQIPNQKVIIDEFHYINIDSQRARAYIDGIRNTNPESSLLLMSATFGQPERLIEYLNKITGREFILYHTNERATKQVFLDKPADLETLKDAIVFVFSYRGAVELAEEIAYHREPVSCEKMERIKELAKIFSLESIPEITKKGVGVYVGSLLPKEKLFMETAFRERLIDVIVGTDALSLGVNLPAQTVVFAQLAKYYDGPLSKNEFLQMAGRAGRKGYFDTGYITFYPSSFESFEYDTEELYQYMLKAPQEPMKISVDISIPDILRGKPIEEEAEYVAKVSYPMRSKAEVEEEIEEKLEIIDFYDKEFEQGNYKKVLADIYYPEYNFYTNLHLAELFCGSRENEKIDIHDVVATVFSGENVRNEFYGMLQINRFLKNLPKEYRKKIKNKEMVHTYIQQTDQTVTKFEEIFDKIKKSKEESEDLIKTIDILTEATQKNKKLSL